MRQTLAAALERRERGQWHADTFIKSAVLIGDLKLLAGECARSCLGHKDCKGLCGKFLFYLLNVRVHFFTELGVVHGQNACRGKAGIPGIDNGQNGRIGGHLERGVDVDHHVGFVLKRRAGDDGMDARTRSDSR